MAYVIEINKGWYEINNIKEIKMHYSYGKQLVSSGAKGSE